MSYNHAVTIAGRKVSISERPECNHGLEKKKRTLTEEEKIARAVSERRRRLIRSANASFSTRDDVDIYLLTFKEADEADEAKNGKYVQAEMRKICEYLHYYCRDQPLIMVAEKSHSRKRYHIHMMICGADEAIIRKRWTQMQGHGLVYKTSKYDDFYDNPQSIDRFVGYMAKDFAIGDTIVVRRNLSKPVVDTATVHIRSSKSMIRSELEGMGATDVTVSVDRFGNISASGYLIRT